MAVPKRKTTKSRSGKRRSHIKFNSKNVDKVSEKYGTGNLESFL